MASCAQTRLRWEGPVKGSRFIALAVVAAAALWVASGHLFPRETAHSRAALPRAGETEEKKPFRVAVTRATIIEHARRLTLSGRTEADKRVVITARGAGVLTELRVKRGMWVQKHDIIAVLSDEAREAQVAQAQAVVTQKRTELEAKRQLIINGTLPRLQLVDLEAQLKAAEASLAAAEAERDRGIVRAPWSGVVQDLAVEIGQAAFSFTGKELATLVALDPMLVVVEVAERKLAGIRVGEKARVRLVSGEVVTGKIRFVAKTASQLTRTYRVEVELPNRDGNIPDGITAEVSVPLQPVPAAQIPRSALTFSPAGDIGVRTVDAQGKVEFAPVAVVEDEQSAMWVGGLAPGTLVIVQGQDFVREGQRVEAVGAAELTAVAR
jgi:membrane fusion protein, multidrug efflux system